MQEDLEKYIKAHRQEFDEKLPRKNEVWSKIKKRTPKSGTKPAWLKVTSAACFVGLILGIVYFYQKENTIQPPVVVEEQGNVVSEFEKIEQHYLSIGKEIEKKLTSYEYPNKTLKKTFEKDLNTLDSNYLELKKQLKTSLDERIIEALIENLNARVKILKRQQEILQHIKTLKPKENETLS